MNFQNKHILIGISGSIAAYKIPILIRFFVQGGADVRVVATKNALQFITPTTIKTLTNNDVYYEMFDNVHFSGTEHISITDWADIFVIAPATANIIGKMANGIADDTVSTSFLAFNKQVFVAPAMNVKMWNHPILQKNITILKNLGVRFIHPESGDLACGYQGTGRMAEPLNIANEIEKFFDSQLILSGKKILVTAGPTYEPIDPVRFIGNKSSGKMGFAIAEALASTGADVILISGPTCLNVSHPNITLVNVTTTKDMLEKCNLYYDDVDGVIMNAAVSDFYPVNFSKEKIKKTDHLTIELAKNPDILSELAKKKKHQWLIGFALETDNELNNAIEKLKNKNLDAIILNSAKDEKIGMGSDFNKITIIKKDGTTIQSDVDNKKSLAYFIVDKLILDLCKK
ncbi:MAG TPA: bifunctional phosphopantothenoylcysteine decarboxylase/phosphopantothenate--cysteine ligase CoaBC [Bacteroidales bacterium]|jgi:phosphopantothenoylcysteine decarboxylase/phosphopantothenate--cysteine ligase|nr:bifunctional phosphopantothenoylcysteine decarboxylase/phosphopantothenate--cysteine ligase CoaBC [Bacteroidales bacterium]